MPISLWKERPTRPGSQRRQLPRHESRVHGGVLRLQEDVYFCSIHLLLPVLLAAVEELQRRATRMSRRSGVQERDGMPIRRIHLQGGLQHVDARKVQEATGA